MSRIQSRPGMVRITATSGLGAVVAERRGDAPLLCAACQRGYHSAHTITRRAATRGLVKCECKRCER